MPHSPVEKTMSNKTQDSEVQPKDNEDITEYFDLDQASAPESPTEQDAEQDAQEASGESDKSIPGFEPIVDRQDGDAKSKSQREAPKQNFSGGSGPYLLPQSSRVTLSPEWPVQPYSEYIRMINEAELMKEVPEIKSDIDRLPSQVARINWKKELQEIYRRNNP
ncbi:hypothetical protein F5Y05DRAFT_412993 [Hypoxylon sp. FL0543]|nr:hypothetical protein F5Y05DRAFT_412993 [Hypoxylon sp. FL0543]